VTDFHRRHNNIATNPVKEDGIKPGQIIRRKQNGDLEYLHDDLTVEEPLEIRIGRKTVATTMRTPGSDEELAAGFLVSEGIIQTPEQIANFSRPAAARNRDNIIITTLTEGTQVKLNSAQRFGTISSSCGICGKESIGAIRQNFPVIESAKDIRIDVETKGGTVRLAGPAPNAAAKARAGEIAKAVNGVATVDNQLVVSPG